MALSSGFFGRVQLAQYSIGDLIQWGEHLAMDHPSIDAQHEAIFSLVGEVHEHWRHDAGIEKLHVLIDKLWNVLESHFRYEEGVLAEMNYPKLVKHAAEHRMMLDELQAIRRRFETGDLHAYPQPGWVIFNFMLGVTVGHIVNSDIEYCRYASE